MFFASINEAFGVDSLEKTDEEIKQRPKTAKAERVSVDRTKFPTKEMVGEDIPDEDSYEIPAVIPEERKLTDLEVRKYISKMYTKGGIKKVWSLLDQRIRKKVLAMCNKTIQNTHKWFEDLMASPEKLLILLAIIFVLILLLDSTSSKPDVQPHCAHMYRPVEQIYYPQQAMGASNGPELRW